MIGIPSIDTLRPEIVTLAGGRQVFAFRNKSTSLVRLDFLHEAGSYYQPSPLVSGAACKLHLAAGGSYNADRLSEFMDYRGILVDHGPSILQTDTSVYFLRRYAEELLPVLAEVMREPAFPQQQFEAWCSKRRQEMLSARRKTGEVARKMFYKSLFGESHPLGRFAEAEDVDRLRVQAVRDFYNERYGLEQTTIVAGGDVDDQLLALIDRYFQGEARNEKREVLAQPNVKAEGVIEEKIDGAVQTTVRVGRVLPLRWDEMDYAWFMLLVTALGGYFGSRLMGNLREDKGYTYGIYARTQIFRGVILFFITADVAAGTADDAVRQIKNEMRKLREEPMGTEELEMVKRVFVGDFLRSVDGVFELTARFCDMLGTDVDERLTENLRRAINETTAPQLQELAGRLLKDDDMLYCLAGA